MNLARFNFGLPVLRKELIEQANRKRTYVLRALYAAALFTATVGAFYTLALELGNDPLGLLGQGRWMFEFVFWVQIGAIYLLLPAMLAGTITTEKERDTLALLLLTELRPWEIILQKLLGRIFTVFTFMLLSLPLLAVAYAFGGVSSGRLGVAAYVLLLTCLQVGAVTIMCSAFFASTAVAFMAVYIILGPLYFTVPFLEEMRITNFNARGEDWPTFFPALPALKQVATMGYAATLKNVWQDTWSSWFLTLIALVLARRFLITRALRRPRNIVRAIFRVLDQFFTTVNRIFAGGIILIRDRGELPDRLPVAWMERTRRAIGKPHHLARIAVLTEVPTVLLCIIVLTGSRIYSLGEVLSVMLFIAWPIVVLWLSIQAAGAFATERSRQTLNVLLATPMDTRQIIREKTIVLWNFAAVLALPLATIYLVEAAYEHRLGGGYSLYGGRQGDFSTPAYLTCGVLAIIIYMRIIVWLSMWLGMWLKTQARAAMAAITILILWCTAPIGLIMLAQIDGGLSELEQMLLILSPAAVVIVFDLGPGEFAMSPWAVMLVHFGLHAAIASVLRHWCIESANRLLGRVTASDDDRTSRDSDEAGSGGPDSSEPAPSPSRLVSERQF